MTAYTPRQGEIYTNGLCGRLPKIPTRIDKLEEIARQILSPRAFAFISGGAGREETQENNRNAFKKWAIVPRILQGNAEYATSISLFGQKHIYPFMLTPLGAQDLAHKQAEVAVGRAAAAENITLTFSNQASTPMEAVAAVMGNANRWFQLYWSKFDEFNASILQRAQNCGCSAIIITLDTQMLGWRTRDLDLGSFPFLYFSGMAQYISDPFAQKLIENYIQSGEKEPAPKINLALIRYLMSISYRYPGNFFDNLFSLRPVKALRVFSKMMIKPALTWEDIVGLRKITKLPIILKGVLHPEDAKLALQYGIDGVMVSSHGGRQLSSCVPSLEMLPEIAAQVKGKIPILLDSGIQGGDDIFKALALGADAVLIGRAYLYALAIAGEEGVRELIQNLKAELELTMTLSGCASIKEITQDKLRKIG